MKYKIIIFIIFYLLLYPMVMFADSIKVSPWSLPLLPKANQGGVVPPPKIKIVNPNKDKLSALSTTINKMSHFESLDLGHLESICGIIDDTQHVELYDGSLGPTRNFVDFEEPSIGQIQWNSNLHSIFNKTGDSPGKVNGVRWCSGTLISENQFLTAGHCFIPNNNTPIRGQVSLNPHELAKHMHINFNYQLDGNTTDKIRKPDSFPITRLIEYGFDPIFGNLDYAVVEIGVNTSGKLPGDLYRISNIETTIKALNESNMLTIIQHPAGNPKMIEAGPKWQVSGSSIFYKNLDTLGGTSGSPVIDQEGRVIAVHTNGGCHASGGANRGITLNAISKHSKVIK